MYALTILSWERVSCFVLCRFLVEGPRGNILHTGDFRAEPWFTDSVKRHPVLQPYIAPKASRVIGMGGRTARCSITRTLDAIYLDTACVLSNAAVPIKVSIFSYPFSLQINLPLRVKPQPVWLI